MMMMMMMMRMMNASILSILLAACLPARSAGARERVLVLLDDPTRARQSHASFLGQIESMGLDVTTASTSDNSTSLRGIEDWSYDHLVVLGAEGTFGEGVTAKTQLEFFESGRNLYLALSPSSIGNARALAGRLGADLEARSSLVMDPFEKSLPDATVRALVDSDAAEHMLPDTSSDVVFVDGIGFSIAPEATMTVGALHASPTAFAAMPGKDGAAPRALKLGGYNLKLAALVQGRNNARAAVIGSTEMLSDAVISRHVGNKAFAEDSLEWVFGQRGVLRPSGLRHRRVGSDSWNPAEGYRVKDEIEVAIDIEECAKSHCGGYGGNDVQVEMYMLDPYVRRTLTNTGNGTFVARIQVPDKYGVFKIKVDYTRPGLSWIHEAEIVAVRPFRHDEYERFLTQAYPYYASVLAMVAGFLAVSRAFVFH